MADTPTTTPPARSALRRRTVLGALFGLPAAAATVTSVPMDLSALQLPPVRTCSLSDLPAGETPCWIESDGKARRITFVTASGAHLRLTGDEVLAADWVFDLPDQWFGNIVAAAATFSSLDQQDERFASGKPRPAMHGGVERSA